MMRNYRPLDSACALSARLFLFRFFFVLFSFPFYLFPFYPCFCLLFRVYAYMYHGYVPGIISLQVMQDGNTYHNSS